MAITKKRINQDWKEKMQGKTVDVELSQKALNIVIRAFSYLHDHYNDTKLIEHNRMMISQEEIKTMINKLKDHKNTSDEPAIINMGFNDWVIYSSVLNETSSKIPLDDQESYEILDDLNEQCYDLDEGGFAPTGP